jgi:hypothetical protein
MNQHLIKYNRVIDRSAIKPIHDLFVATTLYSSSWIVIWDNVRTVKRMIAAQLRVERGV